MRDPLGVKLIGLLLQSQRYQANTSTCKYEPPASHPFYLVIPLAPKLQRIVKYLCCAFYKDTATHQSSVDRPCIGTRPRTCGSPMLYPSGLTVFSLPLPLFRVAESLPCGNESAPVSEVQVWYEKKMSTTYLCLLVRSSAHFWRTGLPGTPGFAG